jgi:hypothetical protein
MKAGCTFKGAKQKDYLLNHMRNAHPDSYGLTEYEESVASQKTLAEKVKWLAY